MKRFMILSAATLGAFQAQAADLPVRAAPPIVAPVPVTWTGFYIGAHGGAILDDSRTLLFPSGGLLAPAFVPTNPLRTASFRPSGVSGTGGGQAGYNYQFSGSSFVIGVEVDGSGGINRPRTLNLNPLPAPLVGGFTGLVNNKLDYLGTVRGRLGYAFGDVLVYGTGGFAYTRNTILTNVMFTATTDRYVTDSHKSETGYAYGGGIEYKYSPSIVLRAEYLHYDFGKRTAVSAPAPGFAGNLTYSTRVTNNIDVVRGGISYLFNTPLF